MRVSNCCGAMIYQDICWEGTFVAHWDREEKQDFIPLREINEIEIIGNDFKNPKLLNK